MVIRKQRFSSNQVRQVLGGVLGQDLHAKRVASLCDATLGVLRSASRSRSAPLVGASRAAWPRPQACRKQVDRLLSNPEIKVDDISSAGFPLSSLARAVP